MIKADGPQVTDDARKTITYYLMTDDYSAVKNWMRDDGSFQNYIAVKECLILYALLDLE